MTAPKPIGYSYIRFSSPEQAGGDSLRRQTQDTEAWCRRNGIELDTTLNLRDEGVSAFRGSHRDDKYALGQFLKQVERGRIARGSYLVVENLDRLSREDERKALRLWMDILDAGINIVQLTPETVFRHEQSDMMDIMRAIIDLSRGHNESVIKSRRLKAVWENKRNQAAEKQKPMTGMAPAWLRLVDGKWQIVEPAARAVRRIFELVIAGYGMTSITKKLNAEGISPIARKDHWIRGFIGKILQNRNVVGELQPYRYVIAEIETPGGGTRRVRRRVEDGEPIKDYYPPIISDKEWYAARAALESRKGKVGRLPKHAINVFAGLLFDSRDGSRMHITNQGKRSSGPALVSYAAQMGAKGTRYATFPFGTFERGVLSCLREIDPRDILKGANGHDEVMVLEGELGQVESAIAAISADLDAHGESPTLYVRLRAKEARKTELVKELDAAKRKAANPASAIWGECKSLLEVLDSSPNPEETRIKLRGVLRRLVRSIHVLIVPAGRERLAWVGIRFTGDVFRGYFICHRPNWADRKSRRPAYWRAESWAGDLNEGAEAFAEGMEAHLKALEADPDYEVPDDPEASGFGPEVELLTWYDRVKDEPGWIEL
jgi:DNA invertase Pin-like site-specific DNA recombinase